MNYRSVSDLNSCIVAQQHRLPRDIDLVVGIPRSGLLAANLIALHLNLPMTDLDGFLAGRLIESGLRLERKECRKDIRSLKALVVDDSIHSGRALSETKERVRSAGLDQNVIYACVFADPNSTGKTDFYFDTCPMPRIFEWNIMHHAHLEHTCVDIDGVLCRDPSEDENDDCSRYASFLGSVELLMRPSVEIGWLVTCRLEKYRAATIAWLDRHGIRYRELIMMDYANKAARVAAGSHSAFKAEVYRKTNAVLFIESSPEQALKIAQITGRDVFCMETREMINPTLSAKLLRMRREPSKIRGPNLRNLAYRLRKWLRLI